MGAGRTESSLRIEKGPGRKRSHVILRSKKQTEIIVDASPLVLVVYWYNKAKA